MKQKTVSIIIAVAVLLFLILAGRYGFTVVSIEDAEKAVQSEAFDPVAYVDGIWESKLLPTFNEKAVELPKILSEMKPDANGTAPKDELIAIANQYGLITVGEAHVYMVKGSGKIVSVNAETSLGTAEVALDGYDGPIKVLLYIGTRIPSDETSVRDAVGFHYIWRFQGTDRVWEGGIRNQQTCSLHRAWRHRQGQPGRQDHFIQGRIHHPHIQPDSNRCERNSHCAG